MRILDLRMGTAGPPAGFPAGATLLDLDVDRSAERLCNGTTCITLEVSP